MKPLLIKPHGGKLEERMTGGKARDSLLEKVKQMSKITLDIREIADLELMATGALSPLKGYMIREEYLSVLYQKRLVDGLPWTIPITLQAFQEELFQINEGDDVALLDRENRALGVLHLEEKYKWDKEKEATRVYQTNDKKHPGVNYIYQLGDYLLGGKVEVLNMPFHKRFIKYRLPPSETRKIFRERGWRRVVGFQTRNPIHRGHEYVQKCALEICDGLFVHPLVGETRKEDVPPDVRIKTYEVAIENYYPKDRVLLAVLPAAMRYAGPREAIFHAIIRKNYGCTHFIVGRDHAGVGNYYGPFDAQYIFDEFDEGEMGITPLFFDDAFYCKKCKGMATAKICPHPKSEHISLSGTKIRKMLKEGKTLPPEFVRPEVAKILMEG
jgi:sulfate adenylyltransferase